MKYAHVRLVFATLILSGSIFSAEFPGRNLPVTGTVADESPYVVVKATGDDASTGCAREYVVDVTYPGGTGGGSFSQAAKLFPGANTVKITSFTATEERKPKWSIAPAPLKVRLEWAGDDHDYDLYVNEINWTAKVSAEGSLDIDSYAGEDTGAGIENVIYPKAKPGIYKIYVNYYSDHGDGGSNPTTITVHLGQTQIFAATQHITEAEPHGGDLSGTGVSVWNVATIVISGSTPGGYRVVDWNWAEAQLGWKDFFAGDGSNPVVRRDNSLGVFPVTNHQVNSLTSLTGFTTLGLVTGQAAQFTAKGTVNSSGNIEDRLILGRFQSSNVAVGPIDDLGVLTGASKGKTVVSAEGVGNIDVYVSDIDPRTPVIYMLSGHDGDFASLAIDDMPGVAIEWKLKNGGGARGDFQNDGEILWGAVGTKNKVKFRAGTPGAGDVAGHSRAQSPGKNTIELRLNNVLCWQKPIEVIEIKTRAFWGAAAPAGAMDGMAAINAVTFHHTSNVADGAAEVKRIQDLHMGSTWFGGNGWSDIGYHYLMSKDGTVFAGRPLEGLALLGGPFTKGSHVENNNTAAGIGVCVLGDYEGTESFPPRRQYALERILSGLCRRHGIVSGSVTYHKVMATTNPTACMGSNVIPKAPAIKAHIDGNLK